MCQLLHQSRLGNPWELAFNDLQRNSKRNEETPTSCQYNGVVFLREGARQETGAEKD